MKEISNSTLAMLVIAAILVSVTGTFVSLSKLNQIQGISGFATSDAGYANLTVSSTASIILTDDLIELGILGINETNSSEIVNDWWIVQNDGGVNISVEIYAASQGSGPNADEQGFGPFTTTTNPAGTDSCLGSPNTCFLVKCKNTTSNGTSATTDCNNSWYSLYTAQGDAQLMIDLPYWAGNDTAWFGANVTVPPGESAGNKQQAVTFYASCSDEDAGC